MDAVIAFYRQVFTGLTEAPEENKDRAAEIYKYMLENTLVEPVELSIDHHLVALELARWTEAGWGDTEYKTLSVAGELHYASEMSSEADSFFAEKSIDFTQTLPLSHLAGTATHVHPEDAPWMVDRVTTKDPNDVHPPLGPMHLMTYEGQFDAAQKVASASHVHSRVGETLASGPTLTEKKEFISDMLYALRPYAEMNTIHEMVGSARLEVDNLIKAAAKLRKEHGL